jgi:cytochrome c peroxidase
MIRRPLLLAAPSLLLATGIAISDDLQKSLYPFPNENGVGQTYVAGGRLDTTGPFFQSLGTNGRSCATCHQPGDSWSVSPRHIQQRFNQTQGTDPIFRTNDGANCSTLDTSTVAARRSAYSMLLDKGVIRVELPVPVGAEFTVVHVDNPYGCTSAQNLSVYRRPLPATNLRFLTTIMWDGREPDLLHQANDATTGHAQGADLPENVKRQIVDFETLLTSAQIIGPGGKLDEHGNRGGPLPLSAQQFFLGINDPLDPNAHFTPNAFDLFSSVGVADDSQAAVGRGQAIFNTKPIAIQNVTGLNDVLGIATIGGTCTTCHNTPNVGNHSVPLAVNIGINDASRRTPEMPLFLLANKTTGETVQTLDPGRALITGKWKDIGKTKGPILRALSGRAPYFHNGSAATLNDVVDFYDTRFSIGLTAKEKSDLVAFLSAL